MHALHLNQSLCLSMRCRSVVLLHACDLMPLESCIKAEDGRQGLSCEMRERRYKRLLLPVLLICFRTSDGALARAPF